MLITVSPFDRNFYQNYTSANCVVISTRYTYTGFFKKIWTSSTLATEVAGPDNLWFFPMGIR